MASLFKGAGSSEYGVESKMPDASKVSAENKAALKAARAAATFKVQDMHYLLHHGKGMAEEEARVRALVSNDPVYNKEGQHDLSRVDRYKKMLSMVAHTEKRQHEEGIAGNFMKQRWWSSEVDQVVCVDLHNTMFTLTIQGQGSPEQQRQWMPLVASKTIIGTYAQTELGHGSNLRGLETTATFDAATDEFVINTPTLTATKWWPGGLGKASTHCILMARLLIGKKDYGQHAFMVQLRRQSDHMPVKGVTVGDIGPTFGFTQQDNGFLAFDNVRIPRSAMLSRFAQVSKDGTYSKPPHSKLKYGTMMAIRAGIVMGGSSTMFKALTIAVRYSYVRKQFGPSDAASAEHAVIFYQTQQYKLFPYLATAYAFHFTGKHMLEMYLKLQSGIQQADFSSLPEAHATSSGLKAIVTSTAAACIEQCRLACGGHGYSMFSGLPLLYQDYVASVTYEGENTLMLLQTARYLNKAALGELKQLPETLAYIAPKQRPTVGSEKCTASTLNDMLTPEVLLAAFKHRAARLCFESASAFNDARKRMGVTNDARSSVGLDATRAATAHCYYTIAMLFHDGIKTADKGLRPVLQQLFKLFCVSHIEQYMGDFVEDGYMTYAQTRMVHRAVRHMLPLLLDNAVALVDAFGHSDHVLDSSLGRYDGDVYRSLWERAQKASLNKGKVVDGYEEYLKPMLQQRPWPKSLQYQSKL